MDTQNYGTRNSRHITVELGCAAVYMSPNFAHTIVRITGYLNFVPKSFMDNKTTLSEHRLDLQQKSTLEALLEMVVPKRLDGKMPSAGEVGFEEFLQEFDPLFYGHDLPQGVRVIHQISLENHNADFAELPGEVKASLMKNLRLTQHEFLEHFRNLVMVCYYQHDQVFEGLGLEARPPFPRGYHLDELDYGLLEPVKKRGKRWRENHCHG